MSDIEQYNGNFLLIYMADSYFDASDYSEPVKTYSNNILQEYIAIGYGKQYDVYLSPNKANTKDSAFSIFESKTEFDYLSHDFHEQYFDPNTQNLVMY